MNHWFKKGRLYLKILKKDATGLAVSDSWKERIYSKETGKIVNKKPKYDKSHPLGFIDVNNLPYCILSNRAFSNYIVLFKLY